MIATSFGTEMPKSRQALDTCAAIMSLAAKTPSGMGIAFSQLASSETTLLAVVWVGLKTTHRLPYSETSLLNSSWRILSHDVGLSQLTYA